jgi:hypothetical protein
LKPLLLVVLFGLAARTAHADVQRFAVIVGNDAGHADDQELAYAESDAEKVYRVLRELGGFDPVDMVLLKGESAETIRSTLISVNDRIRTNAAGNGQSLLFVYYSGHADATAVRAGPSRIALKELAQLVRGSAATFRLMVLDACRSGALTRLKGGRMIAPFFVPNESTFSGEGLAFLTASAAHEDAQESDEIRGSFFTHALVSGLLGAADRDADGLVVLDEAYRYAYDATLRATSRTAYGVQHPTFEYDFKGQGGLVLTAPGVASATRATLRFPTGIGFLVMRDGSDGPVVAELSAEAKARTLSLRPGTYFVRGRRPDVLLEGELSLAASETRTVDLEAMDSVQYARLVRKGGQSPGWAHGLDVGALVQSYAPAVGSACVGAIAGYTLELEHLSFSGRLGACRSTFENEYVQASTAEYEASVAGMYAWDLPQVTFATGLGLGASLAHQRFGTQGHAPSRTSLAPLLALVVDVTLALHGPLFARFDGRAVSQLTTYETQGTAERELDVTFALRGSLLVGIYLGQASR